jgi:hypothetical protein
MTPSHRKASDVQGRPLAVALGVLGVGTLVAASVLTASTTPEAPADRPVSLVAAPGAESSQFTCGGMTEGGGSLAAGTLVLTNATSSTRAVALALFDDAGHRADRAVEVPGYATRKVPVSGVLSGGTWMAAQATIQGGGVAVTQQTAGSGGVSLTSCASATETRWDFAGGSTQTGSSLEISLVNPTSSPAVANVSFISADAGAASPSGSQGIVVPAHRVTAVSVADVVAHGKDLASLVTVTQGRLVAFATQSTPSPIGLSLTLGQSGPSPRLTMARAVASPGATVAMELVNPTSKVQHVSVRVRIPSGWLSPWTMTMDPYSVSRLEMAPSTRVPETDVFAALVRADGPGVLAFASTTTSSGGGGRSLVPLDAPAATSTGSWVLPRYKGNHRQGLTLFNPGQSSVTVTGAGLSPLGSATIKDLTQITIPARGIVTVDASLLASFDNQPLSVTSSGPLAVAETLDGGAVPGILTMAALPRG